jgi:uncharacterized DUF497 family protein
MNFDWHPKKAKANLQKHSVSFEEATLVFEDVYALEEYDDAHSTFEEKRFNRIGVGDERILYVVSKYRTKIEKALFSGSRCL